MNKLVYLFELDSVRKSEEEIKIAQKAMYEEIVLNGNIVVMTMNQLSDSLGFITAVNDNDTTEHILALFQTGILRVSSFWQDDGTLIETPSQYLQMHLDKYLSGGERGFYFSGWFIEDKERDLIKAIKSAFQCNNPGVITEYGNKSIHYFTNTIVKKKPEALEDIETFVRMILQMSGDTLAINPAKDFNSSRSMIQFLDVFMDKWDSKTPKISALSFSANTVDDALDIIGTSKNNVNNGNNRSEWYVAIRNIKGKAASSLQMAEAIIDLCYNYACEDSILGISRHYTKDTENNSFYEDFLNRLHLYWKDKENKTHEFLAKEGSSNSIICKPEKWAHISKIMLYSHKPQERGFIKDNSSDRKKGALGNLRQRRPQNTTTPISEEDYEKNFHQERFIWNLRILIAFFRIIAKICIYIFMFIIINMILKCLSDKLDFDNKGTIVSTLGLLIFSILSSWISTKCKVPDIIDLLKQLWFMLCFAKNTLQKKANKSEKGGSSYCRISNKKELNQ